MTCIILPRFGSILCLVCIIYFVSGLYEKDIGKRDLYFQNVGIVHTARFHISPQRKRTFVGSEDNVIASFNLKSSKIGWRYVFPEDEPIDILEQSSQGLLSVTGRRHVSLFTLDGYLTWDTVLHPKPSTWIDALFLPDPGETGRDVAILFNNTIQFRSSKDGALLDTLVPEEDFMMYKLHVHESVLYAFGGVLSSESSQATLLSVDLTSNTTPKGKFIKNLFIGQIPEKPQQLPLLVNGYILALNMERDQILLNQLGTKNIDSFQLTELLTTSPDIKQAIGTSSLHLQLLEEDHQTFYNGKSKGDTVPDEDADPTDPTDATTLSDTVTMTATAFLVTTEGGSRALFSLEIQGGNIQFLKILQKKEAVSSVTYVGDKALVATIQEKTLTLFDISKSGLKTTPLTFDLPIWNTVAHDPYSQEWNIGRLWLNSVSKNDGSLLHHLLASGNDGGLAMLSWTSPTIFGTGASSPVGLRWKREEALSQVIESQFIDFPVDLSMLEELTNEFSSDGVVKRIISHTTVLFQNIVQWILNVPSVLSSFVEHFTSGSYSKALDCLTGTLTIDADLNLRDRFGYTKLMLLITKVGKALGVHSKTGEIKWDRYYPNQKLRHIFSVKKSVNSPEVVLLGISPDNHWWMSIINPLTGDESSFHQLDYQIKHTLLLPSPDDHQSAILLLFDSQDRVHLYPNTPRTRDILSEAAGNIFFYIHDSSAGSVSGYGVTAPPSPAIPRARVLWRKIWSESSESIVTVTSGTLNAHSPAHVLGDNSVLWKYLNPNLVIIGTTTKFTENRNSDEEDSENSAENYSVTIYVLDIVTGLVVHRTQHRHATSPLHVVHSENWIVCYFWNTKSFSFQISTEELFRGPDWNGEKFSSFMDANVPLDVMKNSYLFTSSARAMAVTTTTRGITNKQILLGLSSGQVVSLDKRFVDSRRPVRPGNRPTMEDQMEGIIPYYPIIDINPLWFISYNLSIPLLRSIQTAPTQLESTTLVLCYGLDLFYVAMSGSNMYDRLDPNLNRSAILLLLGVLVLMWFLASHLAKRSTLKASWK